MTSKTVKNIGDNSVISTETFSYDAAGNVTSAPSSSFQYDTNNRLISFNGNTVSYDLDGNMPGAVPHTSTVALSNATFRYGMMIAEKGLEAAMRTDAGLANGLNIYGGKCVNQNVAKALNLPFTPVSEVI